MLMNMNELTACIDYVWIVALSRDQRTQLRSRLLFPIVPPAAESEKMKKKMRWNSEKPNWQRCIDSSADLSPLVIVVVR